MQTDRRYHIHIFKFWTDSRFLWLLIAENPHTAMGHADARITPTSLCPCPRSENVPKWIDNHGRRNGMMACNRGYSTRTPFAMQPNCILAVIVPSILGGIRSPLVPDGKRSLAGAGCCPSPMRSRPPHLVASPEVPMLKRLANRPPNDGKLMLDLTLVFDALESLHQRPNAADLFISTASRQRCSTGAFCTQQGRG